MSRTASCSCGQLTIRVNGEPLGVGICHCLSCQQRTRSIFAALAPFAAPWEVTGQATELVRTGDQGAKFRFRFCPVCGSNGFHTEEGIEGRVSVAVGAFADPSFPPPKVSVYDCRRHPPTADAIRGCNCPPASRYSRRTLGESVTLSSEELREIDAANLTAEGARYPEAMERMTNR